MREEIFFIRSFPCGKRSTFCALVAAKIRAITEPNNVNKANKLSIHFSPFLNGIYTDIIALSRKMGKIFLKLFGF